MTSRHPLTALCLALLLAAPACATTDADEPGAEDEEILSPEEAKLASPACGTVMSSYLGVAAYSNGRFMGTGESCNGSHVHGLRYQCVELAMRFFNVRYGVARFRGHARQLLANARGRAGLEVYANGDAAHPPVPGDMLVWTNGTWGHVGIISAVTPTTVTMIEQNASNTGKVTMSYNGRFVGPRPGRTVRPAGWIHATANRRAISAEEPWQCADSAYQGGQLWTCNGTSLYKCEGGVPTERACAAGCVINPLGTDDTCKPEAQWSCADSDYEGEQLWTCGGDALHRCTAGVPEVKQCQNGCAVAPLGTDDTCL